MTLFTGQQYLYIHVPVTLIYVLIAYDFYIITIYTYYIPPTHILYI